MADRPPAQRSPDFVIRRAAAPWHAPAMGVAVGITAASLLAALTMFHGLAAPADAPDLRLLGQFFYGYTVSWTGVVVGAIWAFVVGVVVGWSTAVLVNVCQATWPLVMKMRSDASHPVDYLDRL